jgi:5-methylcytosine-specific restriction enzyme A
MPFKPAVYRPPGAASPKDYDTQRDAQGWRRWYKLKPWLALRRFQLQREPLCAECQRQDPPRITAADTVHHKVPHRGDYALFHDPANLESVCSPCHNGPIQSREMND